MLRLVVFAVLIGMASPAMAESPEGIAYFELNKCVKAAAERYSKLDEPLATVASTALAHCREQYLTLEKAVSDMPNAAHYGGMIDSLKSDVLGLAMATAADVRLAATSSN